MATVRKRGPGRPPRVTRAEILERVVVHGFDRGTSAAVAADLGVDPSALYRHFPSREAMLSAAADEVFSSVRWPAPDSRAWQAYLRSVAEALWDLLIGADGFPEYLSRTPRVPHAALRQSLAAVRCLVAAGFAPDDALLVVDSVSDLVMESAAVYQRISVQPGTRTIATRVTEPDVLAALEEIAPVFADVVERSFDPSDPGTYWVMRKVDLILLGAAALRALPNAPR